MPRVKTFADVMAGRKTAEIHCPRKQIAVRLMAVQPDGKIEFDAMAPEEPKLLIDPATPVQYEPWDGDRGNLIFYHDMFPGVRLKLCTELDFVVYPDGKREQVLPAKGGLGDRKYENFL